MRKVTLGISIAIIVAGSCSLNVLASDWRRTLSILPFSLGPLIPTIALSLMLKGRRAQVTLAMSSACYGAWFAFVYHDLFYAHPDPQSPIALLFVGIYAIPAMAIFWAIAVLLRDRTPANPTPK
jgi:hypothetical protein